MPQADTNSYEVTYEHFDTIDKLPLILTLMLSINYNVDMNANRVIIPAVPAEGENPGTPEQVIDTVTLQISKNGVNPVTLVLDRVLVWDNNRLSVLSTSDFLARYTPKS
ncbi:hypothetical protein JVX93_16085 [Mycolicibacterium boenickei]|nr:hypothetical protein JVX93_16085 [Mycolicibacterium boenickei]